MNGRDQLFRRQERQLPFIGRQGTIALALVNPLGGIDQLLHGSDHLRGWGTPAQPDPVLLTPRGFDAATSCSIRREPALREHQPREHRALRSPFRVSLDVSLQLGPSLGSNSYDRFLRPGRAGTPRSQADRQPISSGAITRNVPDPYVGDPS